jgi:hypothetical protein
MHLTKMFVPVANGECIEVDDLFMVINTKMPEYEIVFQCSGFDMENRICKWNESKGFHYLNVVKVGLFECTSDVKAGDSVFVSYNIRFPGMITRHYYKGIVESNLDRKSWLIVCDSGVRVVAPKEHTYRLVRSIENKTLIRYGNRGSTRRRLRASSPAG